jgi:MFS transporter, DHA2 family, multidrug resistance protein
MNAQAEQEPGPSFAIWLGFSAMVVGNFMAVLDIQIVASAIGNIQAGVGASRDEISWVQTAYLIAEVIGIPLAGYLDRALGTRLLFCLSAAFFTLASVLCACSWDLNSLIFFRVLQGFSGAAMIPMTFATLLLVFPKRLHSMGLALVGLVTLLGPTFGPTVGGYLAETLGWRALFWINLAPGIVVVMVVWATMAGVSQSEPALLRRIDFIGLFGMAAFLGAAQYVLEEGPLVGWFESGELVVFALVSVIGGAVFFWRALTLELPIVDLRPFLTPTFAIGASLGFVLGLCLMSTLFLTPLFLGSVRGYNSLQIGEAMFLQGFSMLAVAPLLGWVLNRVHDTRLLGWFGFLLLAASSIAQSNFTAQSSQGDLVTPQILRAVGIMITFSVVQRPSLGSLPPHLVHAGSGLFNTMRTIGGAFGIAGMTTLRTHSFALHRQELYSALDPSNPQVQGMLAQSQAYLAQTGAPEPERQALMQYASLLDREALAMAFNDQFLFLAVLTTVFSFSMWFLKPPRPDVVGAQMVHAH